MRENDEPATMDTSPCGKTTQLKKPHGSLRPILRMSLFSAYLREDNPIEVERRALSYITILRTKLFIGGVVVVNNDLEIS